MMELMIAASFGYDSGQTFTVASGCLGGQAERSVSALEAYRFLEDSDAVAASVLGLPTGEGCIEKGNQRRGGLSAAGQRRLAGCAKTPTIQSLQSGGPPQ